MSEVQTLDCSPVVAALQHSRFAVLRRIEVLESANEVILNGTVTRYYLKQIAQETVLPLMQGRQLLNHIEVVRN